MSNRFSEFYSGESVNAYELLGCKKWGKLLSFFGLGA